jgi:CelD/BcsL family acetyltransferase involved in cellulose biosynthesis
VAVYSCNPLADPRWAEFVERHPNASIFHTPGWLQALHLTYGYEPVVFTTSAPGVALENAIVFCRIASWLTGRRLVSLPFADHCQPLVNGAGEAEEIIAFIRRSVKEEDLKYVEIRPRRSWPDPLQLDATEEGVSFCFHIVDLKPDVRTLFANLQKSSIQSRIRRAERLRLSCKRGRSEALLQKFYSLVLKTRRRHHLPPQPISWFRNLIAWLGDNLEIRVAEQNEKPLAAILTLSHKRTLIYKYGASDENYHHCGSMPFLLWDAIRTGKQAGFSEFDLGRSDLDNPGLITFKNRLGATSSIFQYVRFSRSHRESGARPMHLPKWLFACMPDGLLTTAGKLLYRHIG